MPANRFSKHPTQGTNMVQANRGPNKQQAKGRTCAVDDCKTTLSVYNPKDVCGLHEDFERLHPAHWMKGS